MHRFFNQSQIQQCAWIYSLLFLGVVVAGYTPGLSENGLLLGAFKIDVRDDVLHTLSGIWAAYSAWKSPKAAWFYFRAFGIFYTADAFLGFFSGYAFVDLVTGHFNANEGYSFNNFNENLNHNLPHFIIGPLAIVASFVLKRTPQKKFTSKKG